MDCGCCGLPGSAVGVFGNARPEFEDVVGTPLCQQCYTGMVADRVADKIRWRRGDFRSTRYERMQRDDPFNEDPAEVVSRIVLAGLGVEDP